MVFVMIGVDISVGDSLLLIKLLMDCLKVEYCFINVCVVFI